MAFHPPVLYLGYVGFTVPFVFAAVAALCQPLVGHWAGTRLDTQQPSKLAAIELGQVERALRAQQKIAQPLLAARIAGDSGVRLRRLRSSRRAST